MRLNRGIYKILMSKSGFIIVVSSQLFFVFFVSLLACESASVSQLEYYKTLLHGVDVLRTNFKTILICTLLFSAGGCISAILISFTNKIGINSGYEAKLHIWDLISLGTSGSLIVLTTMCFLLVEMGIWSLLIFLFFAIVICIIARQTQRSKVILQPSTDGKISTKGYIINIGLFLILFGNLLLIKYGYIYELEFPLNIDSVNHAYFIKHGVFTQNILHVPYYHYAFHYIIIFLNRLTQEDIPKLMLLFGQLLQIAIPITMFFPIHRITKNSKVALASVFISGVMFSMPSVATSWGKYPALMAIVSLNYCFYMLGSFIVQKNKRPEKLLLVTWTIIAGMFIHSRILVLLIIGFLFLGLDKVKTKGRKLIIISACSLILILLCRLDKHFVIGEWDLALIPYRENSVLLAIYLILVLFSIIYYPKYTARASLFVMLTMIFVAIPISKTFMNDFNLKTLIAPKTLIDRPFLSMFLFIPLSLILGLSLAGLEKYFQKLRQDGAINIIISFFILYPLLLPTPKVLHPLSHVNLVTRDDLLLFQEIENSLPDNTSILIPNAPPNYGLGLDGGAWLEFATNQQTIKMGYDTVFTSDSVLKEICAAGVNYIYVGNKSYSFSAVSIEQKTEWYQIFIEYPETRLYEIVGCS